MHAPPTFRGRGPYPGTRLDHILISPSLNDRLTNSSVDTSRQKSDHFPIQARFQLHPLAQGQPAAGSHCGARLPRVQWQPSITSPSMMQNANPSNVMYATYFIHNQAARQQRPQKNGTIAWYAERREHINSSSYTMSFGSSAAIPAPFGSSSSLNTQPYQRPAGTSSLGPLLNTSRQHTAAIRLPPTGQRFPSAASLNRRPPHSTHRHSRSPLCLKESTQWARTWTQWPPIRTTALREAAAAGRSAAAAKPSSAASRPSPHRRIPGRLPATASELQPHHPSVQAWRHSGARQLPPNCNHRGNHMPECSYPTKTHTALDGPEQS